MLEGLESLLNLEMGAVTDVAALILCERALWLSRSQPSPSPPSSCPCWDFRVFLPTMGLGSQLKSLELLLLGKAVTTPSSVTFLTISFPEGAFIMFLSTSELLYFVTSVGGSRSTSSSSAGKRTFDDDFSGRKLFLVIFWWGAVTKSFSCWGGAVYFIFFCLEEDL